MTMTPRTDAEASIWNTGETVNADFARKLETELAFAKNAVLEIREWTPDRWADLCT